MLSRLETTLLATGALALAGALASWQLVSGAEAGADAGSGPVGTADAVPAVQADGGSSTAPAALHGTAHAAAGAHGGHGIGATLHQRTLLVDEAEPLALEGLRLVTDTGAPFDPAMFEGRWSLVFLGYTSCPHVCPMTLHTLSAYAGLSANAIARAMDDARLAGTAMDAVSTAAGDVQLVFLTVDPEHDSPARMHAYLQGYDAAILGLTGPRADVDAAIEAFRGGYRLHENGVTRDHSTTLFAVSPAGRVAGLILTQPSAPAVATDLATIIAADLGAD